MKQVLIIGRGGAGKSALARQLSDRDGDMFTNRRACGKWLDELR